MDNYLELERILKGAFSQCSEGKGKERHADDEPFQDQKICVISRWLEGSPCAGPLFQAAKKIFESARLTPERAIHELRGAIIYTAAAILLLEEQPPQLVVSSDWLNNTPVYTEKGRIRPRCDL